MSKINKFEKKKVEKEEKLRILMSQPKPKQVSVDEFRKKARSPIVVSNPDCISKKTNNHIRKS